MHLKCLHIKLAKKQLEIASNFWGFNEIKTPEELKKILALTPEFS